MATFRPAVLFSASLVPMVISLALVVVGPVLSVIGVVGVVGAIDVVELAGIVACVVGVEVVGILVL